MKIFLRIRRESFKKENTFTFPLQFNLLNQRITLFIFYISVLNRRTLSKKTSIQSTFLYYKKTNTV